MAYCPNNRNDCLDSGKSLNIMQSTAALIKKDTDVERAFAVIRFKTTTHTLRYFHFAAALSSACDSLGNFPIFMKIISWNEKNA